MRKRFNKLNSLAISLLLHFGGWIPDKLYLKWLYRLKMGKKLDLIHPQTFSEKLQWLKLYDRKPEYTKMVDKYAVKEYVAGIIGEEYIIPTFGVWDKPKDIEWDKLPNKFVLKTTHGGGGGGVVICHDIDTLDKTAAIVKLKEAMKQNLYLKLREWPYKNVSRGIIAEQLLEKDPDYNDVPDYKFYCFNGEPKVLLIATNRFTEHNFNYFDMSFTQLPITSCAGNNAIGNFKEPPLFDEMKNIAYQLSQGLPHVRVDLYYSNGRIYFGELTFFDSSGYDNLSSDEIDLEWGNWIELPFAKK